MSLYDLPVEYHPHLGIAGIALACELGKGIDE
jgi:hypothetical protein